MTITVDTLIKLAEFWFTSAAAKADEAVATEGLKAGRYVMAYDWRPLINDLGEAAAANGWTVTKDPATGHVATFVPPPEPYVAPAHQSPADFNRHSS